VWLHRTEPSGVCHLASVSIECGPGCLSCISGHVHTDMRVFWNILQAGGTAGGGAA
jgi:hypothetical protein